MTPARELFRDESAASWGIDEPLDDGLGASRSPEGRYVGEFPRLAKNPPVPEVVEKEAPRTFWPSCGGGGVLP